MQNERDKMNADRNDIELSGRLTQDIKLGETRDGRVYGLITIVIRNGGSKQAEFFDIFIWNKKIVEFYGKYLVSGKRVVVKGALSRKEKQIYINVTEDYGMLICIDIRDLKKEEKGSLAWIAALEEENSIYERKLRNYEEKYAVKNDEATISMSAAEAKLSKSESESVTNNPDKSIKTNSIPNPEIE